MRHLSAPTQARHRIGSIAGTAMLALVCLLALLTVVIPFALGAQSYTVLTGSMRPALEPGYLIAVRETPIEDIRIGDIVTYQLRSGAPEVVTHRVVGVGHDGTGARLLTTQGDDNNVADATPVREVQLRGVLVYAVPWLGHINLWTTPAVKSVIVTALGVLAIGWGLFVLAKDARRRRTAARATASAVAIVALALASATAAAPAGAQGATNTLLLSTDGITWTPGPTLAIVDGIRDLVPGDTHAVPLWIRNVSPDTAEFRVSAEWLPADPTRPSDVALAETLTTPMPTEPEPLQPGADSQIELPVRFAPDAGNVTRQGTAALQLTVTLTQIDSGTRPPLPPTGIELPIAATLAGTLIALGGLTLLLRGKRRDRRD